MGNLVISSLIPETISTEEYSYRCSCSADEKITFNNVPMFEQNNEICVEQNGDEFSKKFDLLNNSKRSNNYNNKKQTNSNIQKIVNFSKNYPNQESKEFQNRFGYPVYSLRNGKNKNYVNKCTGSILDGETTNSSCDCLNSEYFLNKSLNCNYLQRNRLFHLVGGIYTEKVAWKKENETEYFRKYYRCGRVESLKNSTYFHVCSKYQEFLASWKKHQKRRQLTDAYSYSIVDFHHFLGIEGMFEQDECDKEKNTIEENSDLAETTETSSPLCEYGEHPEGPFESYSIVTTFPSDAEESMRQIEEVTAPLQVLVSEAEPPGCHFHHLHQFSPLGESTTSCGFSTFMRTVRNPASNGSGPSLLSIQHQVFEEHEFSSSYTCETRFETRIVYAKAEERNFYTKRKSFSKRKKWEDRNVMCIMDSKNREGSRTSVYCALIISYLAWKIVY